MIEWFTWLQLGIATTSTVLCLSLGFAKKVPSDLSVGSLALVWLLLLAQLIVALFAPIMGNHIVGDPIEFWVYLVSAVLVPPAAILWSFVERNRWSTVILGIAALTVTVMNYRMFVIWTTLPG